MDKNLVFAPMCYNYQFAIHFECLIWTKAQWTIWHQNLQSQSRILLHWQSFDYKHDDVFYLSSLVHCYCIVNCFTSWTESYIVFNLLLIDNGYCILYSSYLKMQWIYSCYSPLEASDRFHQNNYMNSIFFQFWCGPCWFRRKDTSWWRWRISWRCSSKWDGIWRTRRWKKRIVSVPFRYRRWGSEFTSIHIESFIIC